MNKLSVILCLLVGIVHSAPNIGSRIIGGQQARAGQFPFQTAIAVNTVDGQFFCGGVLVDAAWILTAGHCCYNAREFTIRLGTNRLNDTSSGQTVATSTSVIHPDFNPLTLEHDLCLIHLHMAISYDQYCHPINFARSLEIAVGSVGTVSGWGQLSDATAGVTLDLHYVDVVVISNDECKLTYGDQIKDNMLCTLGNYNEGICVGDTGGPLVVRNGLGAELLGAIAVFFSQLGCETLHPSGYIRVDTYYDWIQSVFQSV